MTRGCKGLLALLLALTLLLALFPAAAMAEEDEGTIEPVEDPAAVPEDPEDEAEPAEAGVIFPLPDHGVLPEEPEIRPATDDLEEVYSGSCGGSLNWSLNTSTAVLTITGSGDMRNYTANSPAPWCQYPDSVAEVRLPSGLTRIGNYAFYGCWRLSSVDIPSKVSSIGDFAFEGCSSLVTVEIPAGVTSMGNFPFIECFALKNIIVAAGNPNYSSKDGVLYDKAKTVLLTCPAGRTENVNIPYGVKTIESLAFFYCQIPSVSIPTSVTAIGYGTFAYCFNLPNVTIPANVAFIGDSAFAYCLSLKSIDVSSKNQTYNSLKGILYDKDMTVLFQCPCAKTGTVSIPSGVTYIQSAAFEYCYQLTAVTIPASVTEIGSYAFDSCYSMTAINVASTNPNFRSRDGILYDKGTTTLLKCPTGKAGNLAVPDGVTTIASWAFAECFEMDAVKLPASVTSIEDYAFAYCSDGLNELWFEGRAPSFGSYALAEAILYGYYPAGDASWRNVFTQNFGGIEIVWTSYTGNPDFNPFNDVKEGKYYYGPVLWAYYHDPRVTSGVSDTLFGPDQTCTRGQIVTFLWNACGQPEPEGAENPFEDVQSGKYYYKAVLWAVENGITNGVDETHFGPDNKCSRAQVVTFLWNAYDKPEPTLEENPFEDVPEDKWYTKAVLWAVEVGITSGVDASHFAPDKICTRGQVVTFLYNALEKTAG